MVKVIELITTLNTGGAESLIKDYCTFMDKDRVRLKVVVMSGRYDSLNEKMVEEAGVEVIFLQDILFGAKKKNNPIARALVFFSRYWYFRKIVLKDQPDVIHVHLRLGNYFKFLPLKRLHSKLILTVHNTPERYFDSTGKDRDRYREYKEAYRLIHDHSMTLIALHDAMNRQLRELFDTQDVITVNNGIDAARFDRSLYDRDAVRKSLGIDEDSFVIGNVGRFNVQKNHEKIISVFNRIHSEEKKARLLLIAGSGDKEESVRARIGELGLEDSVIILSRRSDIPELMSAMDVFFLPSKWEGYPIVLLEAQSIGLKCVISDTITKEAILTDNVVCLSTEDDDSVWCDALMHDTASAAKYDELSNFDMKKCIRRVEDIYIGSVK